MEIFMGETRWECAGRGGGSKERGCRCGILSCPQRIGTFARGARGVVAVTAEANERFVEEFDTAGEGGDVADPNIVHGGCGAGREASGVAPGG